MAHEITSTDGLVLSKVGAWHGLGMVVQDEMNVLAALHKANLGWQVEKRPVSVQVGDETLVVPNRFATVRMDTKTVLGIVSDHYRVCQNVTLASVIDRISDTGACPRIESAGSMRGGRDVFFLANLGSFFADSTKKDEVCRYVLFSNSHDGEGTLCVLPTSVRVVCKNTLNAALRGGERVSQVVRHVDNFEIQLENVSRGLLQVIKASNSYAECVQALASKQLSVQETNDFFKNVFLAIEGSKVHRQEVEHVEARAAKQIGQWIENLDRSENSVTSTRGTVWHALNAVTYWSDHQRMGTSEKIWSNLLGPSADIKSRAQKAALELVG